MEEKNFVLQHVVDEKREEEKRRWQILRKALIMWARRRSHFAGLTHTPLWINEHCTVWCDRRICEFATSASTASVKSKRHPWKQEGCYAKHSTTSLRHNRTQKPAQHSTLLHRENAENRLQTRHTRQPTRTCTFTDTHSHSNRRSQ